MHVVCLLTYQKGEKLKSEEFRNNPLFLRNQCKSDGVFEMPIIRRQDIDLKNLKLVGYDQIKPDNKANTQSFVHFFLDNYKFEVIWYDSEPRQTHPQSKIFLLLDLCCSINDLLLKQGVFFETRLAFGT